MDQIPNKYLDIPSKTSEDLAAHVVAYRSLGIDKKFALVCMAELARRRELGEDFNFEDFIDQETKKMPKMHDLDLVKQAASINNNIKVFGSSIIGKPNTGAK